MASVLHLFLIFLSNPQLVYSNVCVFFELDHPHSAYTLTEAGWIGRQAILMTGINSIIYVLSTLPPYVANSASALNTDVYKFCVPCRWYVVDRWGRRTILLSGAVVVRLNDDDVSI